jgi:hypothetical protein
MNPYLIALLLAAAAALYVRRAVERTGSDGRPAKALALRVKGWEMPLGPFVLLLVIVELIMLTNKATFAAYFDSPQSFLTWMIPFLFLGVLLDFWQKSVLFQVRRFLLLLDITTLVAADLAPSIAPLGPEPVLTAAWVSVVLLGVVVLYFAWDRQHSKGHVFAAAAAIALLLPSIAGAVTPAYPMQNPLYASLQAHQTTEQPDHWISNTTEIRVISWFLATQYLHRAYGEAASYLDTQESMLHRYTDPSVVQGRYVWVNAPLFEYIKWWGDRDHPQFVYIDNVPENMSAEEPNVIHKVNQTLDYHIERIEWGKRIAQRLYDRFSDYKMLQWRADVDDNHHLYFVLYLGRVPLGFSMATLERLVIVDPSTGADQDFAVGDPAIPPWLEVVYPDTYVYAWVKFWSHSRFGWYYSWTNKQHLYDPDDSSARFLLINGTAYWQVPLRQANSNVLGGYAIVNTRTGEAVFYDREVRSMADTFTAMNQVSRYLISGQLGFQHLDIHEAYLYPFRMADGKVREAYVLPLYAGFTIAKYAILDAVEYTASPMVSESLADAAAQYSAHSFGVEGAQQTTLVWQNVSIENAYVGKDPTSSQEEAVVTFNNTTYVITMQELRGGQLVEGEDEWRELNLAVAEFERTGSARIWVSLAGRTVLDVDFDGADLVNHE